MKTHWKSAYKSIHLSSADLNGKELILTITAVKREEHRNELCNIAYFKENGYKPMRLNVGNAAIVRSFAGGSIHIEDWKFPVTINIYVDPRVKMLGNTVEGLRIRKTQAKANTEKIPLSTDKYYAAVQFLKNGKTMDELKSFYSFDQETEDKLKLDSNA